MYGLELPDTCEIYVRYMSGICQIDVRFSLDRCQIFVRSMSEICQIDVNFIIAYLRSSG